MKRMLVVICVVLTVSIAARSDGRKDAPHPDLEKLQGTWKAVSVEVEGQLLTGKEIASIPHSVIKDKTFGTSVDNMPFELQSDGEINRMTLAFEANSKKFTSHGIYKIDRDKLTICMCNPEINDIKPSEFKTKSGDGLSIIQFERVKP